MKLLLNLVRKDFNRNPAITTALTVFLILAALLMAGGLRVAGTMISAYDGLNHKALPPDYLQMHKGEYQAAALEGFVASQDGIADFLTVRMLTSLQISANMLIMPDVNKFSTVSTSPTKRDTSVPGSCPVTLSVVR